MHFKSILLYNYNTVYTNKTIKQMKLKSNFRTASDSSIYSGNETIQINLGNLYTLYISKPCDKRHLETHKI